MSTITLPVGSWEPPYLAAFDRALLDAGYDVTVTDFFCGAGGSSSGLERIPGVRVVMASNHWDLAIQTHNRNLPHADHDRADISGVDPRRYPTTDIGWFSPECTTWSQARGEECDYDSKPVQLELGAEEDDQPVSDEAKQRSRAQMEDVVRFTRHHRYKAVLVENVTDILKWRHLDRWLGEMRAEGYAHKIVILNSAFATALGLGAPQLRDRVYFIFWQVCYPEPNWNKWLRPRSYCPTCGGDVRAIQVIKPGKRRAMRYGAQYFYRCPQTSCRGQAVQPYALPAAAAIDWSLPAQRIGDRKKPLQPKTLARIEAGLRKYAPQAITLEAAGHTFERRPGVRTWPASHPLTTLHTTASKGLACPPMLVPSGGTWNDEATPVDQPMRTRTTRETEGVMVPPFLVPLRSGRNRSSLPSEPLATIVADGANHALVEPLVVPVEGRENVHARPAGDPMRAQTARLQDALVVPLRNNGVARPPADYPLMTFAAGGEHHALVMRNNTARGDQGQMSTPVDEPIRTVTTAGHQSLIRWDHLVYAYDTGKLRPIGQPLPAQTTVQGDGVLAAAVRVEDCTFRMLDVHEIQAGMAFAPNFVLLGTAKRDHVRMLGNAVTPCSSRDLGAAVVEAITGREIELAAV
ncbi:DNA cytosine methyltransferase [Micromonospora echinospora]